MLCEFFDLIQRTVVLVFAYYVAVCKVGILRSVTPNAEHGAEAAGNSATVAGVAIKIFVNTDPLIVHFFGFKGRKLNRNRSTIRTSLPVLCSNFRILRILNNIIPTTVSIDHLISVIC